MLAINVILCSMYLNVHKLPNTRPLFMDIILPLRYAFSPMNLFSVIVPKNTMPMCILMYVHTQAPMYILAEPWGECLALSSITLCLGLLRQGLSLNLKLTILARYLSSKIPGYSSLQHWGYKHQQMCLTLYMGATNLDSGSQASTTRVFNLLSHLPSPKFRNFFS